MACIKLFPSLIIFTANSFLLEDMHYFTLGLPEHSPVQTEMSCAPFSSMDLASSEDCSLIAFFPCMTYGLGRSSDLWL